MFTGWNFIGILLWLIAIAFLIYVIHYIRVKQLMLIVKTKKAFAWKNMITYIILLAISFAALAGMAYLSFFRDVNMNDHQQIAIKTEYKPLVITPIKGDFYYTKVDRASGGEKPVASYTYWSDSNKYTVSGHSATIAAGVNPVNSAASVYPWNKQQLKKQDQKNGKAFVAVMTTRYKPTFLNGLGVRGGHVANRYTLIRIPSGQFIYQK